MSFTAVYPGNVKTPRVEVLCYQNGALVYGEAGSPTDTFQLGGERLAVADRRRLGVLRREPLLLHVERRRTRGDVPRDDELRRRGLSGSDTGRPRGPEGPLAVATEP